MPIAFILLVVAAVFIVGGIKNWSITSLFTGKIVDRGGSSGPIMTDWNAYGGSSPANTPLAQNQTNIIQIAKNFLGTPYKYGGNDPPTGIDCSRFVQLVYQSVGITLPRTTFEQFKQGKTVSINDLQPGDVIFVVPTPNGPDHEGLYVGNNQVQESPQTGEVNKIVPLQTFLGDGLVGVRRYL